MKVKFRHPTTFNRNDAIVAPISRRYHSIPVKGEFTKEEIESKHPTIFRPCLRDSSGKFGRLYYCISNKVENPREYMKVKFRHPTTFNRNDTIVAPISRRYHSIPVKGEFTKEEIESKHPTIFRPCLRDSSGKFGRLYYCISNKVENPREYMKVKFRHPTTFNRNDTIVAPISRRYHSIPVKGEFTKEEIESKHPTIFRPCLRDSSGKFGRLYYCISNKVENPREYMKVKFRHPTTFNRNDTIVAPISRRYHSIPVKGEFTKEEIESKHPTIFRPCLRDSSGKFGRLYYCISNKVENPREYMKVKFRHPTTFNRNDTIVAPISRRYHSIPVKGEFTKEEIESKHPTIFRPCLRDSSGKFGRLYYCISNKVENPREYMKVKFRHPTTFNRNDTIVAPISRRYHSIPVKGEFTKEEIESKHPTIFRPCLRDSSGKFGRLYYCISNKVENPREYMKVKFRHPTTFNRNDTIVAPISRRYHSIPVKGEFTKEEIESKHPTIFRPCLRDSSGKFGRLYYCISNKVENPREYMKVKFRHPTTFNRNDTIVAPISRRYHSIPVKGEFTKEEIESKHPTIFRPCLRDSSGKFGRLYYCISNKVENPREYMKVKFRHPTTFNRNDTIVAPISRRYHSIPVKGEFTKEEIESKHPTIFRPCLRDSSGKFGRLYYCISNKVENPREYMKVKFRHPTTFNRNDTIVAPISRRYHSIPVKGEFTKEEIESKHPTIFRPCLRDSSGKFGRLYYCISNKVENPREYMKVKFRHPTTFNRNDTIVAPISRRYHSIPVKGEFTKEEIESKHPTIFRPCLRLFLPAQKSGFLKK